MPISSSSPAARRLTIALVCAAVAACSQDEGRDLLGPRDPTSKLTRLAVEPSSLTLEAGDGQQLSVSASWSDGRSETPPVEWSATGGTISAEGFYRADSIPGTYRVIARHAASPTADTIVVTITAPVVAALALGPSPACLKKVQVKAMSGLTAALSRAVPGDCILLASGTYTLGSGLTLTRGGTAKAPVVVQGTGSGTVINVNRKSMFIDASYLQLRRMRLTNFGTVGLWLRGVTGAVLDGVEVDHTQQEALALKKGSHHNIIRNSWFHDTGTLHPKYGEAIYVGNSGDPGSPLDFRVTDNRIVSNRFGPNVRAEAIDLKEGADRTLVWGNFIDGRGAVLNGNDGMLIAVLANNVIIEANTIQYGAPQAVAFKKPSTRKMSGNVATRNRIDLRDQFRSQRGSVQPYGFQFQAGTVNPMGAVVWCDNVMVTGSLSNRPCKR
jgi:hypothetical protein